MAFCAYVLEVRGIDDTTGNRRGLNRECLKKRAFFECGVDAELMRSSLGCLSVFGRWNKAKYKRGKRNGNLNK